MSKLGRPGVDESLAPLHGVTRDGQAMTYSRAPAPDLAPWIARLFVCAVDAPLGHRLDCSMFSDTSTVTAQIKGRWSAQTGGGIQAPERTVMYCGPQSRRLPVTVEGSFVTAGFTLRPGTANAFGCHKVADFVDRMVPSDELGLTQQLVFDKIDQGSTPEDWLQGFEGLFRAIVARMKPERPNSVIAEFASLAFSDPSASIADFAQAIGVNQRSLERIVHRDFGMPPKQVLRRARALDMAAYLRGVADSEEGEEMALRYYDQSHLIHDFAELFGMTPGQFVETPLPILTLSLELRQAWRLEELERLSPGGRRPWEGVASGV